MEANRLLGPKNPNFKTSNKIFTWDFEIHVADRQKLFLFRILYIISKVKKKKKSGELCT